MSEPPSSPPTEHTSPEDSLRYYKAQYEQLEQELSEFQASSQELEAELEKDVEAAEKRERVLQEKVESLGFEVDEWKVCRMLILGEGILVLMPVQTKYKQSKTEANLAQNNLQKEITMLRDTNRSLQMKLRDIEVQNDDFERQARNTSSSLGDLESKLNVAIERGVMMEEDIKIGEKERENLRIETQRLRDELADLKIEAEIMQDKLRKSSIRLPALSTDITAPNSPAPNHSPNSTASSPMALTPPDTKSISTVGSVSETPTPPSPPISDSSAKAKKPLSAMRTPMHPPPSKIRTPSGDHSTTPKPRMPSTSSRPLPRSRVSNNLGGNSQKAPYLARNTAGKASATKGLPNSSSLTHIRSLTSQIQRLEQRVQSARSKLPAPTYTPPRASPRDESSGGKAMPSSVTIRSRKRTGGSTISSAMTSGSDDTPLATKHVPRLSTSGISRLSFGPLPSRDRSEASTSASEVSRPSSRASTSVYARPASRTGNPVDLVRPLSRGEHVRSVSRTDYGRPASRTALDRPASRTSMSGTRTPLGHYSQSSIAESRRPRSSIGGSFSSSVHGHGHSQSVSGIDLNGIDLDEVREMEFSTPSRRGSAMGFRDDGTGIPTPSGLPRRQSGGGTVLSRRTSGGLGEMKPPLSSKMAAGRERKLSEVGESY